MSHSWPREVYLLAVKANPPTLRAAVEAVFDRACEADFAVVEQTGHESQEPGHGRHEERYVCGVTEPVRIPEAGPDVAAVVPVNRVRVVGGKRPPATHYDRSSRRAEAEVLGRVVRAHWHIESGVHWVLDVVYGEGDRRVRAGPAGANLGLVSRVAVALSRRAPGRESGVTQRKMAGWDHESMVKVRNGLSEE